MKLEQSIIAPEDLILITGSNGFLGVKVVEKFLESGFQNLRCFIRSSGDSSRLASTLSKFPSAKVEVFEGNLNDPDDCYGALRDVSVVVNCAAGMRGGLANMYIDSVVSSRNLLDASTRRTHVRRIVHISSFAVYETAPIKRGDRLTETASLESHHNERNEPYSYTKVKQEEQFWKYAGKYDQPLVVLRPGVIFGPAGRELSGRVGLQLGRFIIHLGGSNRIPLTYVENCAEAVVLAATKPGIDGEVFNVVDDDLPTARTFLKQYKAARRNVRSISVHYPVLQLLSRTLTWYSYRSKGQIPPLLTPHKVASTWKGVGFDNTKAKKGLGWMPKVPMSAALEAHFEYVRSKHT